MTSVEGYKHILERQLCEAFGLNPEEVRSLELDFTAGDVAKLTVRMYPDKSKLDKAVKVIKHFELVPKDNG